MATTTPAYGKLIVLKFNGTQVVNSTSNDLNQSRAMRDVTTKDSNDEKESRPTVKARTFSTNGLMPEAGVSSFQTAFDNGTIGTWRFGDTTTGTPFWSGSGYLTALNFKAPFDGNVEYDLTVEVTGTVTASTN